MDNADLVKFASLFNDELTLDNLDRVQLVSMTQLLSIPPFGTDAFLKARLRSHLQKVKQVSPGNFGTVHLLTKAASMQAESDQLSAAWDIAGCTAGKLSLGFSGALHLVSLTGAVPDVDCLMLASIDACCTR